MSDLKNNNNYNQGEQNDLGPSEEQRIRSIYEELLRKVKQMNYDENTLWSLKLNNLEEYIDQLHLIGLEISSLLQHPNKLSSISTEQIMELFEFKTQIATIAKVILDKKRKCSVYNLNNIETKDRMHLEWSQPNILNIKIRMPSSDLKITEHPNAESDKNNYVNGRCEIMQSENDGLNIFVLPPQGIGAKDTVILCPENLQNISNRESFEHQLSGIQQEKETIQHSEEQTSNEKSNPDVLLPEDSHNTSHYESFELQQNDQQGTETAQDTERQTSDVESNSTIIPESENSHISQNVSFEIEQKQDIEISRDSEKQAPIDLPSADCHSITTVAESIDSSFVQNDPTPETTLRQDSSNHSKGHELSEELSDDTTGKNKFYFNDIAYEESSDEIGNENSFDSIKLIVQNLSVKNYDEKLNSLIEHTTVPVSMNLFNVKEQVIYCLLDIILEKYKESVGNLNLYSNFLNEFSKHLCESRNVGEKSFRSILLSRMKYLYRQRIRSNVNGHQLKNITKNGNDSEILPRFFQTDQDKKKYMAFRKKYQANLILIKELYENRFIEKDYFIECLNHVLDRIESGSIPNDYLSCLYDFLYMIEPILRGLIRESRDEMKRFQSLNGRLKKSLKNMLPSINDSTSVACKVSEILSQINAHSIVYNI